jgi:hypothetical protein
VDRADEDELGIALFEKPADLGEDRFGLGGAVEGEQHSFSHTRLRSA